MKYALYICQLNVEFRQTKAKNGISSAVHLKNVPLILEVENNSKFHQKTIRAIGRSISKNKKISTDQILITKINLHEAVFSSKIAYDYDAI